MVRLPCHAWSTASFATASTANHWPAPRYLPDNQPDRDALRWHRLEEEVSDLLVLMSNLVHDQGIDVAAVIRHKLQANERKYPVEKFKGASCKYNE